MPVPLRESSLDPPAETPETRARAVALRALAARALSEAQLRERLEKAGFSSEAAAVVSWLRNLKYLDDSAYARTRAEELLSLGRLGPRLAAQRIEAQGIPQPVALLAVEEVLLALGGRGEGELTLCRALAQKKIGEDLASLDPRRRTRLARFLCGRGFTEESVAAVLGGRLLDDGA